MNFGRLRVFRLRAAHADARGSKAKLDERSLYRLGVPVHHFLRRGQIARVAMDRRYRDYRKFGVRLALKSRADGMGKLLFIVDNRLVVTDENKQAACRRRHTDIPRRQSGSGSLKLFHGGP